MRLNKLTKIAVKALEDIKARDIVVLDVRAMTALYDTLIIATAESARQTKALSVHLREDIKAAGGHVIGSEGEDSGEWVLVDCGEFVAHIMMPSARAHYNLEELWTPPTPVRPPKKAEKESPTSPVPKVAAKKRAVVAGAAKKPAATKKPAGKKVAAKAPTPAAKTPAAKKPAAKKVAAKKTAAKKTVAADFTAAAKPATRRRLKTAV